MRWAWWMGCGGGAMVVLAGMGVCLGGGGGPRVDPSSRQEAAKLFDDAMRAYNTRQYAEAKVLVDQALLMDPQNLDAQLLVAVLRQKMTPSGETAAPVTATGKSAESIPANAAEIVLERMGDDSAESQAAREKLATVRVVEVSTDGVGLGRLLTFLEQASKLTFETNWVALQKAGVDENSPVTVDLKNVPVRDVLETVLRQVGRGKVHYRIEQGVVRLSTPDELAKAAAKAATNPGGEPGRRPTGPAKMTLADLGDMGRGRLGEI